MNKFLRSAMTGALGLLAAVAARADLYVSNQNDNTVTRYDSSTGAFVGTFITAGSGGLSAPHGIVFNAAGDMLVASFGGDQVLRYNGTTGAFVDAFIAGGLDNPAVMKIGPGGHLYVGDQGNNRINRYNPLTGAFVDTFVAAGSGGLNGPSGFDWTADGDLLVSSRFGAQVLLYNGTTGAFASTVVSTGLSQPLGLARGPGTDFWVADFSANVLAHYQSGGTPEAPVATGSGPAGVAFGPDGRLYFANFNSNFLSAYDPALPAPPAAFATTNLNGPTFFAFSPVPEPAEWAALAGALALGAAWSRRRAQA